MLLNVKKERATYAWPTAVTLSLTVYERPHTRYVAHVGKHMYAEVFLFLHSEAS